MTTPNEVWAAGNAYEPYVGRWSRLVAREFITWLTAPVHARWVDVGCGTGALTASIVATAAPAHVCGIDRSIEYAAFARANIVHAHTAFTAADARRLPLPSESVDVTVSGLALNFVPNPELAIAEMARVVRPKGTVALYVWDYAGEMQLIRHFWSAAAALDARAIALDEARRFPVCHPHALEELFGAAGLDQVQSRAIDVPTRFRDFSDYWQPFLGGQGPAPGYAMSLTEHERALLRDRLREQLPTAPDGSIALVARAWAVRGTRV
ncbi:MAG TPA: class I SAM-dependent methyltransferase [Gemmatimonadaceae bacterium]